MAIGRLESVLRRLRNLVPGSKANGATDADLLKQFLDGHDEAAFEALVRRHGPMVLGVCRRVLGNVHDAEDAFQAAFIVLVRKAPSISHRQLLANWLYGVAYRTALESKRTAARRRMKERTAGAMPPQTTPCVGTWQELLPLLDLELSRLPEKYRIPIILCDLEGRARKEAAQFLKLPEGTVSSRLARGREMLARRLSRYGPIISGGTVTLAQQAGAAALSPFLLGTVVRDATAAGAGTVSAQAALLAEGVMKAMLLTKLKVVTGIIAFALFTLVGAGAVTYKTGFAAAAPTGDGVTGPIQPKKEPAAILGTWVLVSDQYVAGIDGGGVKWQEASRQPTEWFITEDKIWITVPNTRYAMEFRVDAAKAPRTIDVRPIVKDQERKVRLGILAPDGDRLTVCLGAEDGQERPANFEPEGGPKGRRLYRFRKVADADRPALRLRGAKLKKIDAASRTVDGEIGTDIIRIPGIDMSVYANKFTKLPVGTDARIRIGGRPVRLEDVKEGVTVSLRIEAFQREGLDQLVITTIDDAIPGKGGTDELTLRNVAVENWSTGGGTVALGMGPAEVVRGAPKSLRQTILADLLLPEHAAISVALADKWVRLHPPKLGDIVVVKLTVKRFEGQDRLVATSISRDLSPPHEASWGKPVDRLRCRWLTGAAVVGDPDMVHLEVENATDEVAYWECRPKITWYLRDAGETASWFVPTFDVVPGKGCRAMTAAEVNQHFGVGKDGLKATDPFPGYYRFERGGRMTLSTKQPVPQGKDGQIILDTKLARQNPRVGTAVRKRCGGRRA